MTIFRILVFKGESRHDADMTLTCEKNQFIALFAGQSPEVKTEGDASALKKLFASCENFTPTFNIIEP